MGDRRHASPLSIRPRAFGRGPSPSSAASASLSIPGARAPSPPPALPPPQFIEDIAVGRDLGWQWGNSSRKEPAGSRIVRPGSSLCGNWGRRVQDDNRTEPLDFRRRQCSTPVTKPQSHLTLSGFPHPDEGYGSLSGSSLANHLQGERPLESQNRKNSSHAYDKRLLSKIGRPHTPTKTSSSGSLDYSPATSMRGLRQDVQQPAVHRLSLADRSPSLSTDSLSRADPTQVSGGGASSTSSGRWRNSLLAGPLSPGLVSSAASTKSIVDFRSPTVEGGSLAASVYAEDERVGRRSDSALSLLSGAFEEREAEQDGGGAGCGGAVGGGGGRFGRSGVFASEPDLLLDFPMAEDTAGMRHLHLEDCGHHSLADLHLPPMSAYPPHGLKRKAITPPAEATHDDRAPPHGRASHQRSHPGLPPAKRASPPIHHHHHHHNHHHHHQPNSNLASYSSASSNGLTNGSYAPSVNLSVGGSSMTSIGSQEHLPPNGMLSTLPEPHDNRQSQSPYVTSLPLEPSLRAAQAQLHLSPQGQATAALLHPEMPAEANGRLSAANPSKMQATSHRCDCCPKKPKKFATLEELQQHRNEKQYYCTWCHNRFKNKNEAERHQNSLHVRRHSWSCATLDGNFHNAFHACTATPPNPNSGQTLSPAPDAYAQYDVCGYCGEQFPNHPQPDWVLRHQHLTNVHKVGECNQSKKFYRADHFRQHLKHSHAGTSGKWTNMLEGACMREEAAATAEAQAQEQLRQQQAQTAHAQAQAQAQAAQVAQAAQAAQQQQQQQQQQQHEQSQPPISQYQAAQLQSAPMANMMGGVRQMRQGPYPAIPPDIQYQTINEEVTDDV